MEAGGKCFEKINPVLIFLNATKICHSHYFLIIPYIFVFQFKNIEVINVSRSGSHGGIEKKKGIGKITS